VRAGHGADVLSDVPGRDRGDFLEVAATKEYPGEFVLLRVHEGGYMANFCKSSGALARQWSQASSGEYLGLYPACTLGALADRKHVAARNFSALAAPRARRS